MLADRLQRAREHKGLTPAQLAEQAGIQRKIIYDLEKGERQQVSAMVLRKIARVLGVGVDYLVGTFDPDEETQAASTPIPWQGQDVLAGSPA